MSEPISRTEYLKTLRSYVSGFVLSIVLTLAAYVVVQAHRGSGNQVLAQPTVLWTIMAFAIAQLVVQLWFFLHLGEERKPRWRLLTLLFAVTVVFILAAGSIWIMANLGYHSADTQKQIDKYIDSQSDL